MPIVAPQTKFTEWKQGWTPREHWEMWQASELQALKDRVEHHEREAANQRHKELIALQQTFLNFKQELAEALRIERQVDRDADENARRKDRSLTYTSLCVAVISIVVSAIIGLIQAGKLFWPDLTQ